MLDRLSLVLLLVTILFAPLPAFAGDDAVLFVYHRFDDQRHPSTNISLADFRAHLEIVRDEGFTVVRLGELVDLLRSEAPLPDRAVAFTVDDAYRSFLDGWELLKEFGYPVTLFVNTDSVGGNDYLSWEELVQLRNEGVEIGNHSAAHAYMVRQRFAMEEDAWEAMARADIERAQQAFARHLGFRPTLFAYPYGEYDPALVRLARQAGFRAACAQQSGVARRGGDLFTLPRFPMGTGFTAPREFRQKLHMRPLRVSVVTPESPVVSKNPPAMVVEIDQRQIAATSLRCFVPGQNDCLVRKLSDGAGRARYEIVAERPLDGIRSKYTLTAHDGTGEHWYWFSQLWLLR